MFYDKNIFEPPPSITSTIVSDVKVSDPDLARERYRRFIQGNTGVFGNVFGVKKGFWTWGLRNPVASVFWYYRMPWKTLGLLRFGAGKAPLQFGGLLWYIPGGRQIFEAAGGVAASLSQSLAERISKVTTEGGFLRTTAEWLLGKKITEGGKEVFQPSWLHKFIFGTKEAPSSIKTILFGGKFFEKGKIEEMLAKEKVVKELKLYKAAKTEIGKVTQIGVPKYLPALMGFARLVGYGLTALNVYDVSKFAVNTVFGTVEAASRGLNTIANKIRRTEVGGYLESAFVTQQAVTERQAALQAMQVAGLSVRNYLGEEASLMHNAVNAI